MLAYIDPGAGSFVLQAIVATLAGVALAARSFWRKLFARLRPRRGPDRDERDGAPRGDG
jgi:hypothetical protein